MTTTDPTTSGQATPDLVHAHRETLQQGREALASRGYFSRYPESPSPRVYGENAAPDGLAAFEAHLACDFSALRDQPTDGTFAGSEVSPYGPELRVRYPRLDVEAAIGAARAAMPAWRDAGGLTRAAVCLEIVDAINKRSFEIANAVMHTSGQPFVMSFQAAGPHAQDRAFESIVSALVEQERVPESVVWEKPGRDAPIRMRKDFRIVGRGIALVIGCNTFPTWNSYPGIFASLATGNPVIVKPHPRAVLPLAISVAVARKVLRDNRFDPALVQLAAESDGERLAKTLAERPEVAIIDYTGSSGFGGWLEREGAAAGKLVYTEKSGVNSIVVDSTDNLRGVMGNLAFSLSLYSGQMCTTPQNIYVPRGGIETDEGHLTFEDFGAKLGDALTKLTGDDAKAVEILGAIVNDDVRGRVADLPGLASRLGGTVVLDARKVTHPSYPDAVVRTPGLVALDVDNVSAYSQECFGPVTFLIATDSTAQSLERMRETIKEHGAMTAAIYSTSDDVLADARDAAAEAGVALSENLTGPVFVNQTAAFSDYHGTGANPAANAAYVDAAFVANRFRVVTSRRHI
ncbi:MAG: phenylacetic acid degradation protein PaaN [Dermatophilaceae bacterium]